MSASGWTTLRIRSITNRQAVISALFDLGAEAVQELETEIVTSMLGLDEPRAATSLRTADAGATVLFERTPDTDWSKAWRTQLTARRAGRLVVTPPWLADEYDEAERVVIDPGMAFGTGDHETTRGVLRLMQAVLKPRDVVADLGTGSGVLAIGAVKLGARYAFGIENDHDAIGNAESNVTLNGVARRVTILEGDAAAMLPLVAPVGLVLANIVAAVLADLQSVIAAALAPGGHAVVGGILVDESRRMRELFEAAGWRVVTTDEEGAWWSATLRRA